MPAVCPGMPSRLRRNGQKARLEGGLEEKVKGKWNKNQIRAKGKSVKTERSAYARQVGKEE